MKKFKSIFATAIMFIMSVVSVNAQMVDNVNLESYAKQQYGRNWEKAAAKEMSNVTLDKMGNMTLTKEIEVPNLSQNELYYEMANWFICNYDNSIQFADKEQGLIIARPYIEDIARYAGGFNAYNFSICPTVRAQVKDGKVSITYSLHNYNVVVEEGGGNTATGLFVGLAAAAITATVADAVTDNHPHHHYSERTTVVGHYGYGRYHHTTVYREYRPRHTFEDAILLSCIASSAKYGPSQNSKNWSLDDCFPFAKKDSHKKASSKAFLMANIYSQVVMDNIQTALNQCSQAYAYNK